MALRRAAQERSAGIPAFQPDSCAPALPASRLPCAAQDQPRRMRDAEKVHDPSSIVTLDKVRRVFSTGPGVSLMVDRDGKWLREGSVFAGNARPAWHDARVPGNRGYLWAPDVIESGGKWFVYYSVSTFGKNTSAIGLAVGTSLDPASADWKWEDRGIVQASVKEDRFNAIDPAIFRDGGTLWMTFGSFWDGIHLVELDPATGLRKSPDTAPLRLASAPEIEAPFLCKRDGWYYLFLNWGFCCRGVNSTYELRAGRSRVINGPYVDRDGRELLKGGGTQVLASVDRYIGPGHASLHTHEGKEYLVHHYYDRELEGRPRLRMVPLTWDADGWPVAKAE
jgi:arabinan endo-1,5-alpha-L-arabinosidase